MIWLVIYVFCVSILESSMNDRLPFHSCFSAWFDSLNLTKAAITFLLTQYTESNIFLFILISLKPHFSSFYETSPNFCIFIAFAAQFAYNSVMCWISVMAFDIWKAFSKFEGRKPNLNKQKTLGIFKPKFRRYFLYSLTIPAIISIITITLFSIPDDSFNHGAMPKLEEGLCFFSGFTFVIYRLLPSGMIFIIFRRTHRWRTFSRLTLLFDQWRESLKYVWYSILASQGLMWWPTVAPMEWT